ncbi:unnamed protein product [Phytophthora lilii]|uniref:Unnamed protein product n=1 Tax=Phytophthora lilii TaxID=2077276 RepID=A0A9W6U695_9STRA|nr:unnamed protein product [Phytophthora lilii]
MEDELRELQFNWGKQLPDERTLAMGQRCAFEKFAANRSDAEYQKLLQILCHQQLLFATLQAAIVHAPLHSTGGDLFEALHFVTYDIVDKMLKEKTESKIVTPFSQVHITGCKECTLISSVFVSDIPHPSLEVVYAAVLAYFDSIPAVMKRHFGVELNYWRLNDKHLPVTYVRSVFKGLNMSWTENSIISYEITPSCGMVHIDVVTDDIRHPVSTADASRYSMCGLTISPR